MAGRSLGDSVIGWYGDVAARGLDSHPDAVRHWLMAGFRLMARKSQFAPDGRFLPSGRRGYALFMRSMVDAMADPDNSVLTSVFMPTESLRALGLKPVTSEGRRPKGRSWGAPRGRESPRRTARTTAP